jgi:5-methylcytosine-specific restriction endonuclease McrA
VREGTAAQVNPTVVEYLGERSVTRHGRIKRSSSARQTFLKSKNLTHTPKGCQVDHVVPLSKDGKDTPSNMQLLCGDALKVKEKTELR